MEIPITYIQRIVDRIPHTNASVWKFRLPEEVGAYPGRMDLNELIEDKTGMLWAIVIHIDGWDEVCWRFGTTIFRSANPILGRRITERSALRNAS